MTLCYPLGFVGHRLLFAVLLLIAFHSLRVVTLAQSSTATLSGTVTDPNSAVVPGAHVTATNNGTGLKREVTTSGSGTFTIPLLPPSTYTVLIESQGFTPAEIKDVTLNVGDNVALNIQLKVGQVGATVDVKSDAPLINESPAVGTVVDRQFVEKLPLNGRSFNTLLQLTPGVVIAPLSSSNFNGLGGAAPGQFSVGGQRSDANNFTVDGVSANFGTGSVSSLGQSGLGGLPAVSAVGGTSSLVSVDALQEFRIETSSVSPEFGRSPGAQVLLATRAGTNQFHGGIFEYLRNDVFDANDWFANAAGLPRAPERHNDFGGFLGGPILKHRTFFFFSYEGARLRLPGSRLTTVPSTFARSSAPPALAPFLNIYPQPNGQPTSPTALTAPFTAVFSDPATLNATSLRVDHNFSDRFTVFARINYAPSKLVTRLGGRSFTQTVPADVKTLTVGANTFFGKISNTIRVNYSTQEAGTIFRLDSFGGAITPSPSLLLGTPPAASSVVLFTLNGVTLRDGPNTVNRTKQFNIVDTISADTGPHGLKFGVDYRLIDLDAKLNQNILTYNAGTVAQFLASGVARTLQVITFNEGKVRSQALSLFAQDTWKTSQRLTLTYGLRWELAPAPRALGGTILPAWSNTDNPAQIAVLPSGTSLWKTTYGNFAPRFGLAYRLTDSGDLVLRAGAGVYYDLGTGVASQLVIGWPNSPSKRTLNVPLPISSITPFLPPAGTLQPPYGGGPGFFNGFASNLKLPRSYQWNVALEKSFAGRQVISATYVGQSGHDLLRSEGLVQPNANFAAGSELLLTNNSARSNFQALELQYRKPLAKRLQALFSYTWSHSIDNSSADNVAFFSNTLVALSRNGDRANSDFDVRHSFSGAFSVEMPSVKRLRALKYLTRDWSFEGLIVARSGFPFNALLVFESPDPTGSVFGRPDRVPGQQIWIAQTSAPGGRILNINAFSVPSPIRQGTEGRNDIPGFSFKQLDLSLGRKFSLTEKVGLQFRADAFNIFNHPNFTNPNGLFELDPTSLQSTMMLNRGLGGLNPLFQEGGPRSFQFSLRLTF